MTLMSVPVIDISPFRSGSPQQKDEVAKQVAQACTDIGFLVISGHGVSDEVIASMYDATKTFFEGPLDSKVAVSRPRAGQIRG